MIHNFWLAIEFAKRDFRERYVGTSLGQLWYLIYPVVILFIYTVIFSDFMKMKLQIIDNTYAYSIYLVPRLLAWNSFSTIVLRMSNSFSEKAHMLKKINVPMYVFQLSIFLTELCLFFISMVLGICFLLLISHPITTSFLWLIPAMFLQTLFAFGLGAIISLLVPFFKDLKEAMPILIQLMFWMTPIIYLKEMVYDKYPIIIDINLLYNFIKIYQNIFLYGLNPTLLDLLKIASISMITLFLAAIFYKRLINTIKDML